MSLENEAKVHRLVLTGGEYNLSIDYLLIQFKIKRYSSVLQVVISGEVFMH
jgi:hypothetical protein